MKYGAVANKQGLQSHELNEIIRLTVGKGGIEFGGGFQFR